MVIVVKSYRLVCFPSTQNVEAEVNKILAENEGADIEFLHISSAPYYKRDLAMDCPKCANEVVKAEGDNYLCPNCKRPYSKEDFERLAKLKFIPAGSLFLQSIVITQKGAP